MRPSMSVPAEGLNVTCSLASRHWELPGESMAGADPMGLALAIALTGFNLDGCAFGTLP